MLAGQCGTESFSLCPNPTHRGKGLSCCSSSSPLLASREGTSCAYCPGASTLAEICGSMTKVASAFLNAPSPGRRESIHAFHLRKSRAGGAQKGAQCQRHTLPMPIFWKELYFFLYTGAFLLRGIPSLDHILPILAFTSGSMARASGHSRKCPSSGPFLVASMPILAP